MPELTARGSGDTTRPSHPSMLASCSAARKRAISDFLDRCGWDGLSVVPIAGDASFRSYFRLYGGRRRAVLMDAPPPQEDVAPYVGIAALLRRLGFSAPEIYAEDR